MFRALWSPGHLILMAILVIIVGILFVGTVVPNWAGNHRSSARPDAAADSGLRWLLFAIVVLLFAVLLALMGGPWRALGFLIGLLGLGLGLRGLRS